MCIGNYIESDTKHGCKTVNGCRACAHQMQTGTPWTLMHACCAAVLVPAASLPQPLRQSQGQAASTMRCRPSFSCTALLDLGLGPDVQHECAELCPVTSAFCSGLHLGSCINSIWQACVGVRLTCTSFVRNSLAATKALTFVPPDVAMDGPVAAV